ncbi:efflux transporter [Thiohalobacter thiocyanaticus]|uniref:Efflux transporter n=1 Tax=Thiohalobacter thiocyanaticus TaxID=585455 RepID=A0A1Z4VVH0_9GAMM|nr:HlyD family efflux transporter periplasmic adaptor subunit [Thiohalobacter thiocyanaticus]BAZ95184.1 efflux transporter [Thiohalobacter thiocyanaticus]
MSRSVRLKRVLPAAGALVIGVAFIILMVNLKPPPAQQPGDDALRTVRVIEAEALPYRVEARGFGSVTPARSWRAVAAVGGRIVYRHPELESGNLIETGTRLLEIDPTRYELAVAAAAAELAAIETEIRQLEQERENTADLLALERQRLELAEQELDRVERLARTGALSQTRRDEQTRATLAQRQAVQSLDNRLRLIPSQLDYLRARRDGAQTALERAREDLADTRFTAPYDIRVHQAEVELHQQVRSGELLFIADGIETAEVEVQVPIPQLRQLLGAAELPADPVALELAERLGFDTIAAELRLSAAPLVRWPARVSRIAGALDPKTRTVPVVLTVTAPYRNADPPRQPPLVRGMYVEAVMAAPAAAPRILVPLAAVHQGEVHVADAGDRLRRRPVELLLSQRDLAVIAAGLAPGERVILDDLAPAIEGMRLRVEPDPEARRALAERAAGTAP